jgi:hypothetical protein
MRLGRYYCERSAMRLVDWKRLRASDDCLPIRNIYWDGRGFRNEKTGRNAELSKEVTTWQHVEATPLTRRNSVFLNHLG